MASMLRNIIPKRPLISTVVVDALTWLPAAAQSMDSSPLRLADGKPNLSGIWQAFNSANFDLQDHVAQKGVPAGQGVVEGNEIPYQNWARAQKEENFKSSATTDPETKCYLPGVPRVTYTGLPFQIFQGPANDTTTILYEYAHANRYIYMKATQHPKGPIDWRMGDSGGHWEGDTLVVDNLRFNDQTWFDQAGNLRSDQLHVVERYTRLDPDHINYEVRIEDPKVFTRPWNMSTILYRRKEKNFQLLEYECYGFDVEKYYP
jgi:hypothetical protein